MQGFWSIHHLPTCYDTNTQWDVPGVRAQPGFAWSTHRAGLSRVFQWGFPYEEHPWAAHCPQAPTKRVSDGLVSGLTQGPPWRRVSVEPNRAELAAGSSLSLSFLCVLSSNPAASWNHSHSTFWCQILFHLFLFLFLYIPSSLISWISVSALLLPLVLSPALLLDLSFCLPSHGRIFICLF